MRAHAYYFFRQNGPNDIISDGSTKKVGNFFCITEELKHMKRIISAGYKTRQRKKTHSTLGTTKNWGKILSYSHRNRTKSPFVLAQKPRLKTA